MLFKLWKRYVRRKPVIQGYLFRFDLNADPTHFITDQTKITISPSLLGIYDSHVNGIPIETTHYDDYVNIQQRKE